MTDTQDTPLLLHREGAIATLTFHRPAALNAIDVPMALALRDAVRTLAQDRALRCVVLEGAGRAFMAGGRPDNPAARPPRRRGGLPAPAHRRRKGHPPNPGTRNTPVAPFSFKKKTTI